MKFKVYRDVDAKRFRKIVVELQDSSGKVLDKTFMFGYSALLGFSLRVKLRKKAMLKLQTLMQELSK